MLRRHPVALHLLELEVRKLLRTRCRWNILVAQSDPLRQAERGCVATLRVKSVVRDH